MTATIYYLEHKQNNLDAKVIRALADLLIEESELQQFVIRPLELHTDFITILEHEKMNIGLLSHEDLSHSPYNLIRFLESENCELIFCASAKPIELEKALTKIRSKGKYKSVRVNNIFNPFIYDNILLDYQVEKLLDIMQFSFESIVEENDTAITDFQISHLKASAAG